MRIQHDLLAMNANRNIKINTGISATNTEKLASGYRINRAADDAAGLSISEKMRALIRGLTKASKNCQDGISMVQTAEGALHEVHDMLQRMNELAVQSANGTNTAEDREALQKEFEHIQSEIDRVSQTTTFNAMRLFADEESSAGTTNAGGTNGTNNTNGTGGANGTNGGNTPSVTSLDGTQQEAPVMRMMSLRSVAAVAETSVTVGDFTLTGVDLVEGEDYSYSDNTLTILSDKNITIANTDSTMATTNRIVIGEGVTANVMLNNVNIDVGSMGTCALEVAGTAELYLTLTGTNKLKSGEAHAGLQVNSSATLLITKESTGTLDTTGGKYGAGIGGGLYSVVGTIIIEGGTIKANGDKWGSGIGSGYAAPMCGDVVISGGSITAKGGRRGAGIGCGYNSAAPNITISSGTVNAEGGVYAGDIVGCTFTTTPFGDAIITTENKNISPVTEQALWSGTINGVCYSNSYEIGDGVINLNTMGGDLVIENGGYRIGETLYKYSGSFTFTGTTDKNITISCDVSVSLSEDVSLGNLTVAFGKTLTLEGEGSLTFTRDLDNQGTIANTNVIYGAIGSTVTDVGNITGGISMLSDGNIDLSTLYGDLEIGNGTYKIGDVTYQWSGDIKLSGSTDKNITISDDATVYLAEDISVKNLTVAENASLSIKEESIYVSLRDMTVTGTLTNNGTVTNDGARIINMGTIDTTNSTFTNNMVIQNWGIIKGTISGTGSIEQVGNGVIDLSQVTSELYISDSYYEIDGTTYNTTSSTYTFTGSTEAKVTIVNQQADGNITVVVPSDAQVGELAVSGNVDFAGSGTLSASTLDIITPNTVTGNIPVIRGNGVIDLMGVSSVEITEDGYVIDGKTYVHTGEITLSGTGYGEVVISGDRDISMNNASMSSLTIKDNSTVNLKLTGYNNIQSGDGITVEEGSTLNITGDGTLSVLELSNQGTVVTATDAKLTVKELDNDGTFENGGEITFSQDGSLLDNDGTFVNTGEITFENNSSGLDNGGTFVNDSGGKVRNDSTTQNSGTLENSGEFQAGGTLSNTGTVQNEEGGSLINSSGTENSGDIINDGSWECEDVNNGSTGYIENNGEMSNSGTIDNDGTVFNYDTLNNNGGTITNDGGLVNSGTVNNNSYGTITNNGTLENGYGGVIDNAGTLANNTSGTVNNDGDITNQENANITNQGTVNNGSEGTIANAGTLTNNGSGTLNNDGAVQNYPTGTVEGTVSGNQVVETGSSDIDLSTLTGNLVITDTGYTIGDKAYAYTGDYNFTGSTGYDITIATSAKIVVNGATGKSFSVTGNSNVEVVVTGGSASPSSFEDVTVEEGSTLTFTQNTGEFGYVNINGTLDNDGTFINNISSLSFGTDSAIENDGTMEFNKMTNIYGDVANDGKIVTTTTVYVHGDCTNSASGTIESGGFSIEETGSLTNDGTIVQAGESYSQFSVKGDFVNNNTFTNNTQTVVYAKGTVENNGTINNNGSFRSIGTVTNNSVINNSGTFENVQEPSASGTVDNNGTINNSGTITNNGDMDNEDGDIRNEGSGTVAGSGTATGNPTVPAGSGNIDLNNLSGDLVISDNGYTIGGVEYAYSGDYTFSGTTAQDITVTSDKKITFDNVTGSDLNIANGATVEISLTGDSTMKNVSIAQGSTLITDGTGNLTVTGTFENNGTYQNRSTLNNEGTFENGGEVENSGTVTNNGTVNNNSGSSFDNDGTVNNNNGSSFTNDGTVTNDGTITGNDVTGNPPTGSGTGGGTGSGSGTGGGTGGGSGSGGTGGATAGTAKNSWWIQAGAEAGEGINIEIGAMNTKVLGIDKGTVNILTQESSGSAITAVSGAIEKLSEQRSRLGAYQNRLEHTIYNLDNIVENTTAAESQIRDADMAELMVEHANNNIIMQAAQAMLAQANQQPEYVLLLLK